MKKLEINLREADESDYGWSYLEPYLEKSDSKRRPAYQALEQIFREHEMYKAIAENMASMQKKFTLHYCEVATLKRVLEHYFIYGTVTTLIIM